MKTPVLEIQHLAKSFGDVEVLRDINLAVEENEVISIIGPSGSGKSTLLRCINLLEESNGGDILFKGDSIFSEGFNQRVYRSKVGMVFQQFNLFNNLTVLQNCMLGQQQVLRRTEAQAKEKAIHVLNEVGMGAFLNAKPAQISGGQKQRVAIARALAMDPEVLLFDEPTSALDPEMVGEVLNVMRNLVKEKMTMLVVTHEMNFARDVSSRVAFMQGGILEAIGTPQEIFYDNQSDKVKQFLGLTEMK